MRDADEYSVAQTGSNKLLSFGKNGNARKDFPNPRATGFTAVGYCGNFNFRTLSVENVPDMAGADIAGSYDAQAYFTHRKPPNQIQ